MKSDLSAQMSNLQFVLTQLNQVRSMRANLDQAQFENAQTQKEAVFHLGCVEIALMRLLLEEEHDINTQNPSLDQIC